MILALGVFASCDKSVTVETYNPADGDGLYSFQAASVSNEFSAAEPTMVINVYRATTSGAATLNISSSQTELALDIPSSVTFADGEGIASLVVGYNADVMQVAKNYSATITMADGDCSFGGKKSIAISAILAYTWESLGNGQIYDSFSQSTGVVSVEILKAVGYNRYRVMGPYSDENIAADGWAPGGDRSAYIEFWVADNGVNLLWDRWWFPGILYDGPGTSIKAYLPTALGAEGDELSKVLADGVFMFCPYWYIDGLGGFGTDYPVWVALPGKNVEDYI